MSLPENTAVFVEGAERVDDYKLRLRFSNGFVRVVDFGPFLRESRNPLIQEYLDVAAFSEFSVKDGDLVWGDYDLCFPIADLYEGRL